MKKFGIYILIIIIFFMNCSLLICKTMVDCDNKEIFLQKQYGRPYEVLKNNNQTLKDKTIHKNKKNIETKKTKNTENIGTNKTPLKDPLIEHLKLFEGFSSKTYHDLDGKIAIGYGFRKSDIPNLKWGDRITEQEAEEQLKKIINKYGEIVDSLVKTKISTNKRNALISFSYNIGPNAFKRSRLLKKVNSKNFQEVADEFKKWNKSQGRIIRGLIKRRIVEAEMFCKQ